MSDPIRVSDASKDLRESIDAKVTGQKIFSFVIIGNVATVRLESGTELEFTLQEFAIKAGEWRFVPNAPVGRPKRSKPRPVQIYMNGERAVFEIANGARIAVDVAGNRLELRAVYSDSDQLAPMVVNGSMVETFLEIGTQQ